MGTRSRAVHMPVSTTRLAEIGKYGLLGIGSIVTIYPFFWVLISSFKEKAEIFSRPIAFPARLIVQNYIDIWSFGIGRSFLNSLVVSGVSVVSIVLMSAMASYILARVKRIDWLYLYLAFGIMIPVHTIVIPAFSLIRSFGLINTHLGLILIYVSGNLPLGVFILVGFMQSIPREIDESALIDGASAWRTFISIIFPLSRPGVATIATLTFLNCWNGYLFALLLLSRSQMRVITQTIFAMKGQYGTNFGPLLAGLVIAIIPAMVLYVLFQEQIIKGMTAGAVKG